MSFVNWATPRPGLSNSMMMLSEAVPSATDAKSVNFISMVGSCHLQAGQGVVYDVTRRETFDNIEAIWLKEVDMCDFCFKTIAAVFVAVAVAVPVFLRRMCLPIMVVANKTDLAGRREVSAEEGHDLAKKHGWVWLSILCCRALSQFAGTYEPILCSLDWINQHEWPKVAPSLEERIADGLWQLTQGTVQERMDIQEVCCYLAIAGVCLRATAATTAATWQSQTPVKQQLLALPRCQQRAIISTSGCISLERLDSIARGSGGQSSRPQHYLEVASRQG
eukprot:875428-Pelagomonas_calceolata.AAC.2